MSQILRTLLGLVFIGICAVYLSVRYLVWPQVPSMKPRIEEFATSVLQQSVTIGEVKTSWDRFMPSVLLNKIVIGDQLKVEEAEATLSWRSLTSFLSVEHFGLIEPRFAVIKLVRPQLSAQRVSPRKILVAGFELDLDAPASEPKGLLWLLQQRRLELIDAQVTWLDSASQLAPVEFKPVQIAIENRGRSHRFLVKGDVLSPSNVSATSLEFIGDFVRPIRSNPTDLKLWRGETYVNMQGLDGALLKSHALAWLTQPQLALNNQLSKLDSFLASGRVWLTVQEQLTLHASLAASAINLKFNDRPVSFDVVGLKFQARQEEATWKVDSLDFDVRDKRGLKIATSKPASFVVGADGKFVRAFLALQPLKLEQAMQSLDALNLKAPWVEPLRSRALRGGLNDFELTMRANEAASPAASKPAGLTWELVSNLSAVSVRPGRAHADRLGVPGFTGLDIQIRATEQGGQATVAGKGTSVTFPGLFDRELVEFDSLAGLVQWESKVSSPLKVTINELNFSNPDAKGAVSGTYQVGGKGIGIIDFKGRLNAANLMQLHHYFPKKIAPPVRNWVRDAVTEGRVELIDFAVAGDIWDFPFRNDENGKPTGVFKIASKLSDVTLAYSPDWPELRKMSGDLVFNGPGLFINMRSGAIFDVLFSRVDAKIIDFLQGQLAISGQGVGPAQDMVRFVNASPITTKIDNFTGATEITGEAGLDLKLLLPLRDLAQTKVDGTINFQKNLVKVDDTLPKFENVTGQIKFSETGFSLENINGEFLGGPIQMKASPSAPGRIVISAQGTMNDKALRALVDNPLTARLEGSANYSAIVDVQGRLSTLEIKSDLVGLESRLPAPFGKAANLPAPMIIKTLPSPIAPGQERSLSDTLTVNIGDDIALAFERRRNPKTLQMQIFKGSFGVRADPVMPDSGFAFIANTPSFDLDQWTPILAGFKAVPEVGTSRGGVPLAPEKEASLQMAGSFAADFSLLPSQVTIAAERVQMGGRSIKNVVVGASRAEGLWRANIAAQEVGGYFTWRDAGPNEKIGLLVARFAKLQIPKARASEVESLFEAPPDQLPGLDISAEEFIFGDINFGKLELVTQNVSRGGAPVWSIQKLTLETVDAKLDASGQWLPSTNTVGRETQLKFVLQLLDSGKFLDRIGIKEAVRGATGQLEGKVAWNGSPLGINFATLRGDLQISLEKGQFLKADPGAAKLISVLNLQSLPKRLTFDFSDVVAEGFTFDRVNGTAKISKGVVMTDDMDIRGVQARIKIVGSADLALETQDLLVTVAPEINAGLASLAYTAINPVIGLGTLVAQTVLRKPIQDAFTYELEVKGPWVDPKVEQKKKTPVVINETDNRRE